MKKKKFWKKKTNSNYSPFHFPLRKTMRPLRADTGPTVLSSPFDAFEDFLEAAWIGRNSQDAKGCNMFAEDCSGEQT